MTPYPCLITELCKLAGLRALSRDELKPGRNHITASIIINSIKEQEEGDAPVHVQGQQRQQINVEQFGRYEEKLDQLIQGQHHLADYVREQNLYLHHALENVDWHNRRLWEHSGLSAEEYRPTFGGCFNREGYLLNERGQPIYFPPRGDAPGYGRGSSSQPGTSDHGEGSGFRSHGQAGGGNEGDGEGEEGLGEDEEGEDGGAASD